MVLPRPPKLMKMDLDLLEETPRSTMSCCMGRFWEVSDCHAWDRAGDPVKQAFAF